MSNKLRNALAIILIGLCAAIPLLQRGMPVGVDTYLHLLRMPHLDALLRSGVPFSRWYPLMVGSYGYPLFNYYPPLGYYPIELLHLLGLSQFVAFKLYWAGGLIIAAGGAFLWGKALFEHATDRLAPAVTLAIAYTCSPFLLNEVFWRGGLSQYSAHILLPYIFWLAERCLQTQKRRYPVGIALTLAALIAAHNVTALVVFPYLLVYLVLLAFIKRDGQTGAQSGSGIRSRPALLTVVLGVLLGLGMSAWYWLPALLETDLIQVERVTQTGIMSYADNFQSLQTLFALPTFYDALQLNVDPPRALHLGTILLAGIAWLGMWRQSWQHRLRVIAATGAVIFGIWMMLPASAWVWQRLPLIHFLQFPFRFWGITTLLLALLAGYGIAALPRKNWLYALIWLLLLLYSAPWSFDEYEQIAEPTLADSVAFELDSGLLGLSSASEYLPLDVGELPPLGEWQLTNDDVMVVESEPLRHVVQSCSASPCESAEKLTFNIFYFPGWQATIDGDDAPIYPQPPHGLIALDLPAGEHTVELSWGSTPPRRIGAILSGISLVGLIALALAGKKHLLQASGSTSLGRQNANAIYLLAPLALFALIRIAVIEPVWAQTTQFDGTDVSAIIAPQNINFGNQVQLIGVADTPKFSTDAAIELDLYWRPLTPADEDLSVLVTLRDGLGFVVGESSKLHIGDFPTRRWQAGKYALDHHAFALESGTPPGEYSVEVTVYRYDNPSAQISSLDEAGNPRGETIELGSVTVVPPRRGLQSDAVEPIGEIAGIGLISAEIPQSPIQVGNPLNLALQWQALNADLSNITVSLNLINSETESQTIAQIAPVPSYLTSQWRVGEQWRGRHAILLPADLAAGRYRVHVDHIELGTIDLTVPARSFVAPDVARRTAAIFGDFAELVGYTLREEAGLLQVDLVWRARSTTGQGYKSFVQLLDQDGAYLAGSDQVPAQWYRPTTSWLTGEYIIDTHTLPQMENGEQFAIGLYDVETLQRLNLASGENVLIVEK